MKNKILEYWAFAFAAILSSMAVSGIAHAQDLKSSGIERDSILIGDQVEWTAVLSVPSSQEMVLAPVSELKVPGVEFLSETRDTLSRNELSCEIESRVRLTSFDSGSYVLPERVARFYEGGSLKDSVVLPSANLYVNTIQIDTATYKLADIKPLIEYPVTFRETLPWIGLALLIAALAYLAYRIIRNLKNNRTVFGKPVVKDPPHITALRALEKIRKEKLWEQDDRQKEFYTELTDAIRAYMEGRFGIQAMESTSNEIFESLSKENLPQRELTELKEVFDTADLVKFAKYRSSKDEAENAIPVAVRFVNNTFIQEIEEDLKNGK